MRGKGLKSRTADDPVYFIAFDILFGANAASGQLNHHPFKTNVQKSNFFLECRASKQCFVKESLETSLS